MAKPIAATPVLNGQDLRELIEDLKRPDTNQSGRKMSLALLELATQKKRP